MTRNNNQENINRVYQPLTTPFLLFALSTQYMTT